MCWGEGEMDHKQTSKQDNFRECQVKLSYTTGQNGAPGALQDGTQEKGYKEQRIMWLSNGVGVGHSVDAH